MSDNSRIEWTDATWNPVVGCTKVSPGCDHCYAERVTERFHGPGSFDRVVLHPERLDQPLRWRRPRRVFVNSMSDLFHDDVPDEFIARVFAVMAWAYRHTFQVLTKRHARMRSLLSSPMFLELVEREWCNVTDWADVPLVDPEYVDTMPRPGYWPLPNVWLGVSVESQQWADIRIPALLDTPAAVRFLSCEPLLGPVELLGKAGVGCDETGPAITHEGHSYRVDYGSGTEWDCEHQVGIDWVIVGGESGPHARPMLPGWARSLRDQCVEAGVPYFFKQWGEWAPQQTVCEIDLLPMRRVGKKRAGRALDGRTWDEYPYLTGVAS